MVQYCPSFSAQNESVKWHIPFEHEQEMSEQSVVVSVEFLWYAKM